MESLLSGRLAGAASLNRFAVVAVFAIAWTLLSGVALAQAEKSKPAKAPAASAATVVGEAGAALDAYLRDAKRFPDGFSGCVLVAKDGAVLLEKAYGLANAADARPLGVDALFDWASVTKQFTAAAVLKLEMQKKLALTDPLRKHLGDLMPDKPAKRTAKGEPAAKGEILVRHLLDHTSGIPHDADFPQSVDLFSRDAVARHVLSLPLASEPGEKWEYNNVAYFLAGALIEKASGKSYETFLRENLFEPAGMSDAGFIGDGRVDLARVPNEDRGRGEPFAYGPRLSWGYRGAGGALASVRDMLRWDQALRGDKLLSKKAKASWYEPARENYALGWKVSQGSGGTRVQHGGAVGKLRCCYLRDLDKPLVVALASNDVPPEHPEIYVDGLAEIARRAR